MVKITNGTKVFEVSRGAFEGIYAKQGYTLYKEGVVNSEGAETHEVLPELTDDEKFCTEILEKPLAQWNKEEVKKFAELKEIDLAGTKNANEGKERIKAFLDAQAANQQ